MSILNRLGLGALFGFQHEGTAAIKVNKLLRVFPYRGRGHGAFQPVVIILSGFSSGKRLFQAKDFGQFMQEKGVIGALAAAGIRPSLDKFFNRLHVSPPDFFRTMHA
nr:hypothetical protein [Roseovarius sp. MMSF_3281]